MNQEPDAAAHVALQLVEKMIDQSLEPSEQSTLEALVLNNANARRVYVERLHLHAVLKEARFKQPQSLADVLQSSMPTTVNTPAATAVSVRSRWLGLWLPLTAGVVLMIAGWFFGRWQDQEQTQTFARLVEVKGARWGSNRLPTEPGAGFGEGRLKLAAGLAVIEFGSGAKVTMEGPAELEIINQDRCYLHAGTLTAHVPPQAVGFVVDTADARLVDHGTDFGISIGSEGRSQVRVFEGRVELQHHNSGDTLELLTRQGANISREKMQPSSREEDETGALRKHRIPYGDETVMLSSAEGQGRAAYAWSPGTDLHFSDQLLMVKYCGRPDFRRKAWLGFDLSRLADKQVLEATLTLMFEPTGWGYASLLPDAVFSVYGVTDDALDDWNDETINWDNAPANDPDGKGADMNKAVKLGSFTMPAGVLDGAFSISGAELASYLNRDGNRYVTLLVVRETGEVGGGGVVHGFAGNKHPLLRPPTLYLSLQKDHDK